LVAVSRVIICGYGRAAQRVAAEFEELFEPSGAPVA
jgi:hypothetical protein